MFKLYSSSLGVGFIKVWGTVQNIEIALSTCALCVCPTLEKLSTGVKVQSEAQKISVGRKTVYEIDPRMFESVCLRDTGLKIIKKLLPLFLVSLNLTKETKNNFKRGRLRGH